MPLVYAPDQRRDAAQLDDGHLVAIVGAQQVREHPRRVRLRLGRALGREQRDERLEHPVALGQRRRLVAGRSLVGDGTRLRKRRPTLRHVP